MFTDVRKRQRYVEPATSGNMHTVIRILNAHLGKRSNTCEQDLSTCIAYMTMILTKASFCVLVYRLQKASSVCFNLETVLMYGKDPTLDC